jgi:hypothetical protein
MDESTLSDLLHKAPDNLDPTSSRVDLDKALKDGRRRQRRTRATVSGTVTVLAAAAVAVTVLLPASSAPSKTPPLADSRSQSTVKVPVTVKPTKAAKATATPSALPPAQTSASLVDFTFTAATDVTAAEVLSKAAHGAQTAPDPDADVPLVNGWPQATYWDTVSQMTSSSCPGQFEISSTWLGKDGSMVVANKTTGPISSNALSGCQNPTGNSVYPVGGYPVGVQLGGQIYTWSQWAALPSDPAELWPIVQADANVGVAPGKGGITFTYDTIANALAQDPVSPAMREALFEVMEKIPGVTVSGQYTDSLGRTGTALTLHDPVNGDFTVVIDIANGQLLAQLNGAPPIPPGCAHVSGTGKDVAECGGANSVFISSSGVTVFISAGPTNTEPTPRG